MPVRDQENGTYIVDLLPEKYEPRFYESNLSNPFLSLLREGEYSLYLCIDGVGIQGSPFPVQVKSPRAAAETSVVIPSKSIPPPPQKN